MIQKATMQDIQTLTKLTMMLWPNHSTEEMRSEVEAILAKEDGAFFIAHEDGQPVGFAQCGLRRDYVEGTETSPVGYLEGIYVSEGFRKKGVAKALLAKCEGWAKEKGCVEFASDCELSNTQSLQFHLHMGFTEANRIICFTKKL